MQLFTNQKIKIGLAVFLAFIVVKIMFAGGVFLADTPRIHPLFMTRLINTPVYLASLPIEFINKLRPNINIADSSNNKNAPPSQINSNVTFNQTAQPSTSQKQPAQLTFPTAVPPPGLEYKPIAKGVYAAEDTKTKTVYLNIKKGTTFTVVNKVINGKTFRLLVPKK